MDETRLAKTRKNSETAYTELFDHFWREAENIEDELVKGVVKKAILTINLPLYAAIIYNRTGDFVKARNCYDQILDEALYVLFLDLYWETRDNTHRNHANKYHARLLHKLNSEQTKELLSIEEKLSVFWQYEHELSDRLKNNSNISLLEIECFTLYKSADVHAYSLIAGFFMPFPESVVTELYHQQLLRDFDDDMEDLAEDYSRQMPNPLLIRLIKVQKLDFSKNYPQQELEAIIATNDIDVEQRKFLQSYITHRKPALNDYKWIKKCSVPEVK